MSVLAIRINDAGIVVADGSGVRAVEPGAALVERTRIVTGQDALKQARLKPRHVSQRHWSSLSLEPGSGIEGSKSAAELAFAQLVSLWERFGAGVDAVILVVPGAYRTEQLGLLLGLAQECGMPVRALVDAAVAASVRQYPGRQLLYVDASLQRVAVTHLQQDDEEVAVRAEHVLATTGLATLTDSLARRAGELFVAATRFDPFRHADTEQAVYDLLPGWLAQLQDQDRIELVLPHRGDEFKVTVARESLLIVASGFYRAVAQLIAQHRESGGSLAVQVSHRLAQLPGFVAELARLDDAHVEVLPAGHAACSVLLAPNLAAGSGEQVKLLKHLAWRAPAAVIAGAPARASAPTSSAPRAVAPTHVVYRGVVYGVGGGGLVIGREPVDGRHTIVVADQNSGVSRAHCELVLRDGALTLNDLSRYGTFVNEKRVAGAVTMQRADVIRIGTPGAELQVVGMEQGDGAA